METKRTKIRSHRYSADPVPLCLTSPSSFLILQELSIEQRQELEEAFQTVASLITTGEQGVVTKDELIRAMGGDFKAFEAMDCDDDARMTLDNFMQYVVQRYQDKGARRDRWLHDFLYTLRRSGKAPNLPGPSREQEESEELNETLSEGSSISGSRRETRSYDYRQDASRHDSREPRTPRVAAQRRQNPFQNELWFHRVHEGGFMEVRHEPPQYSSRHLRLSQIWVLFPRDRPCCRCNCSANHSSCLKNRLVSVASRPRLLPAPTSSTPKPITNRCKKPFISWRPRA